MAKQVHSDPLYDALLAEKREEFFRLLYERYSDPVVAMIWKYRCSFMQQFDAQDILMDVFVRLMSKDLDYFDLDRFKEISGLIRQTTIFAISNFRRKQSKNALGNSLDTNNNLVSSERADLLLEHSDYMEHLLGQLSPVKREVFEMRFKGYCHEEIANELDISVDNSRFHFSSAKKILRELVKTDTKG
jgi:RNA polymerase sigma factor (sigma-70 family)